ncbi:MAG TPA: alpha/beta fold hydrolase, partial [Allosphingosinicella sp.]|nr:alpha/beta fold hydrolase [Allosphingosinicella sp.]
GAKPVPGVFQWYADGAGNVRVGVGHSNEGRNSRLLYRAANGEAFRTLDRARSRAGEELIVPALFLGGNVALALDDRDGFSALYKLDLGSLKLGERVAGVPGYDLAGIVTDYGRSRLLGVQLIEKGPKMLWLDPALAEIQAAFDRSVPGRRALIVSLDKRQHRMLVHVGAADRPGAYYVFDPSLGKMQLLATVNEAIGTAKLHPVRTIGYKARDGVTIAAVLTLPSGRPHKALPVVVMPHGGPFARDAETWDWWAQFLADRGYAVVQPNFRGSSGYGTEFARKGEGQWGLAMQNDLNDALAHLAKEGIVDAKRACMVGASYGGYAALRAAQRDAALYRCAVSYAGVSDLAAMLRYDRNFLNSGRRSDWLRTQAPDLKAVSPIHHARDFAIPVLLVHGKEDRRVPVRQSREMAEKLRAAGKNVRYIEQREADHHFSREADRIEFLRALEAFLAEHNPA